MNTTRFKFFLSLFIIGSLFVGVSFVVQENLNLIREVVGRGGVYSMIAYVVFAAIAVVFVPLSSTPLIPVASGAWGVFWAGILSALGWSIGALAAFWLARTYGAKVVERYISKKALERTQMLVPARHAFWYILMLRMVIPVEILSYALGLLPHITWKQYVPATLIGILPFAFIFASAGTLPLLIQLKILAASFMLFLSYVLVRDRLDRRRRRVQS